jgi:polyhydroxyalkanoate synthesis regulator phasin
MMTRELGLSKLIEDNLKRINKAKYDTKSLEIDTSYWNNMNSLVLAHAKSMNDLTYATKTYHTTEEELMKLSEDRAFVEKELKNKILEKYNAIRVLASKQNELNPNAKDRGRISDEMASAREEIIQISEKLGIERQITKELLRQFDINSKISDLRKEAEANERLSADTLAGTTSMNSYSIGNIASASADARKSIHAAELAELKKLTDSLIESGKINQEKANRIMMAALARQFKTEKFIRQNAYKEMLSIHEQFLRDDAELAVRYAKNTKESTEGILKSLVAGTASYYGKIENTSRIWADTMDGIWGDFSNFASNSLMDLWRGFPETQSEIQNLQAQMRDLGQEYEDAMGQERVQEAEQIRRDFNL